MDALLVVLLLTIPPHLTLYVARAAEAFVVYLVFTLALSLVLHLLYKLYQRRSAYVPRV